MSTLRSLSRSLPVIGGAFACAFAALVNDAETSGSCGWPPTVNELSRYRAWTDKAVAFQDSQSNPHRQISPAADSGAVLIWHCAESGQHGYQWWASDGGVFHIGA